MDELPPATKIIDAVMHGIVTSQEEYLKWSGGDWLWTAPEYLITVNVLKEIASLGLNNFATLEHCPEHAITIAGARGKGKLHKNIRPSGRMDILLWSPRSNKPIAPIEIKNQVTNINKIERDIARIVGMLRRGVEKSTIEYGLVAFYTSCQEIRKDGPLPRLKGYIDAIEEEARGRVGEFSSTLYRGDGRRDAESAWAPCVLLIERK